MDEYDQRAESMRQWAMDSLNQARYGQSAGEYRERLAAYRERQLYEQRIPVVDNTSSRREPRRTVDTIPVVGGDFVPIRRRYRQGNGEEAGGSPARA